jgi:hypothetical protein
MPGWETPTPEVDVQVGGRIRIVMRDPSDETEVGATGEYTLRDRITLCVGEQPVSDATSLVTGRDEQLLDHDRSPSSRQDTVTPGASARRKTKGAATG